MEHEIKIIPDQKLAVINYKGPIEDLDILVSKLMGWVEAEEIEVEGEPFVVYYSPRHEVNEGDAVYDVGIVIPLSIQGIVGNRLTFDGKPGLVRGSHKISVVIIFKDVIHSKIDISRTVIIEGV